VTVVRVPSTVTADVGTARESPAVAVMMDREAVAPLRRPSSSASSLSAGCSVRDTTIG
jgi:hypothetical protein